MEGDHKKLLQSLVGDQVNFIVTQEKSSDPPAPKSAKDK